MTSPTPPPSRRLRDRLLSGVLRGLRWWLTRRPWGCLRRWGRRCGGLYWHLSPRDRRRALAHLEIAFPELSDDARRRRARAAFHHLGTAVAELLHLAGRPPEGVDSTLAAHVDVAGWERVEGVLAAGRPLIVLSGHCGNWELLGPVFRAQGAPLSAVVRALDDPRLHGFLTALRKGFGTETIDRGSRGAARQLLQALRSGRPLVMLIDQDTPVEGVWVPFFGRPAYTPVGAARLALKVDAAVIPAFAERRDDGSHLIRIHLPLDLPEDETGATAVMSEAIERQIRRRPEQWVWMHRRWRRRPEAQNL